MCSWVAITSEEGQLGAHLTNTIYRFISEQEQGVVFISNRVFRCVRRCFYTRLYLPSLHQSVTHTAYSFSGLSMKSLIKCYIGFYFYVLIYNRNLHSFLYRKPQNLGHYLFILLNGTYRAFTDILLSTALLATVVGKATVTNQYLDKTEGNAHWGSLLQLLTTLGAQSSSRTAEAVSERKQNPMKFLLPGFRSPNCPTFPDKSETNHSLSASPLQTRKRLFAVLQEHQVLQLLAPAVGITAHLDTELNPLVLSAWSVPLTKTQ